MKREDEDRVVPLEAPSAPEVAPMPYAIEIWDQEGRAPERVIARASSMVLARAVFAAALSEHRGRRIVLRRGSKVVAESD